MIDEGIIKMLWEATENLNAGLSDAESELATEVIMTFVQNVIRRRIDTERAVMVLKRIHDVFDDVVMLAKITKGGKM